MQKNEELTNMVTAKDDKIKETEAALSELQDQHKRATGDLQDFPK